MTDLTPLLVSITEKAALASYPHIGGNDQKSADQSAVTAMRKAFHQAPIDGRIVIGEGERDQAPMLYIGEKVGQGPGYPQCDIAVDPLEGTGLCARGEEGALCVLALADKNSLLHAPDVYMNKLACGKKAKGHLHIQNPIHKNIKILSNILEKKPSQLKVAVLDRDRHQSLIQELQSSGVSPILFGDGDVTMALLCAISPQPIDLLLGSGGAPEGVLSAVGLKVLGGDFQGQLLWKNPNQRKRALNMGLKNPDQIFRIEDLIKGHGIFCATGVTNGPLVQGVQCENNKIFTETLVLNTRQNKHKIVKNQHDSNE